MGILTILALPFLIILGLLPIVLIFAIFAYNSLVQLKVTELRASVANAKSLEEKAEADNMLSQTLKTLFAVAENYPDLKANEQFLSLQEKLKDIEDNLQHSRRFYNATVRDFNTKIQTFPTNLFARLMGFSPREFFKAQAAERENVKVEFE